MVDLTKIIEDWDLEDNTYRNSGSSQPEIESYPCVHRSDLEPVNIIEPDLIAGPWIAGGAPLRWYQDRAVGENDIDVFCRDARQAKAVIDRVKSFNRFHVKHESDNAVTIEYHSHENWSHSWTIQIITRRYFSSMQEVIDNFDITVCQIGTCGRDWIMAPETARDIRERNLRFIGNLRPDSVKRLTKYWVYGYRPVPGTLESLQTDPAIKWKFSETGDYENAF
jgi:hypothetical protein